MERSEHISQIDLSEIDLRSVHGKQVNIFSSSMIKLAKEWCSKDERQCWCRIKCINLKLSFLWSSEVNVTIFKDRKAICLYLTHKFIIILTTKPLCTGENIDYVVERI